MGVYKEIAKADGSGITTFYRLSEENSTVETTSTGTTETMFDYNDALNKPSINDIALVGNKTLDELGIQPAGDYITEIPEEYITEEELEAKDYATEAFVIEQINNTEHFHREIVDALPLTGKDNILYLVPKKGSDKDIYNEYIWTGVDYEFMGTTAIDLTDYYQKNEVDELLDTKVNKVSGKQLSTNDYTTAEKTKLASLENYDDGELRGKVDALHNYDDTAIKLDIQELKRDTSTNEIDIVSIENELGYKAEVIRLVKSGDWWLCQDAKGNNLTLEMAMNKLGLPKTILLLENLENDGKYYPVEYELKEKYIDIIYKDLEGITHHLNYGYNEYYTNTASGDYIHLEDSIDYPYKKLEVDGKSEQETSTLGNNLLNIYKKRTNIESPIDTFEILDNDWMHFENTSGAVRTYRFKEIEVEPNTTYYIKVEMKTTSGIPFVVWEEFDSSGNKLLTIYPNSSRTITTNSSTKYVYIALTSSNMNTTCDYKIRVMVTKGSTAPTTYEPFIPNSPSPDYPSEIKTIENSLKITSCNKNLCNGISQGIYITQTATNYGITQADSGLCIKVDGISTYTISSNEIQKRYRIGFTKTNPLIDVKGNLFSGINRDNSNASVSISSKDYSYLIVNATDLSAIQIEKSPIATSYEQHLETLIEANLPEGEFIGKIDDTYKDTLKVEYNEEDGQYHLNLYKSIGKVVLNGSDDETYVYVSGNSVNGYSQFNCTINLPVPNADNYGENVISSHFEYYKEASTNLKEAPGVRIRNTNPYIAFSIEDTLASTIEEFKTWLSNNPVTVYYALAIPYVIDLGIVDMPTTYNEITNLFTDSDLMPMMNIDYYTAILENAKDTIIGQDIYLQNEVDNVSSLPASANKGDIRRTKDTKDWYIYDGTEWSAFDKTGEIDLSNYLAKDNTVAYKPATDYNPSTKKYVDDSIADIFIPTKVSQLTNDSGFVLKTTNDLTNYYNKSNTYNKAEVNALVSSSGGGSNVSITVNGDTLVITTGGE